MARDREPGPSFFGSKEICERCIRGVREISLGARDNAKMKGSRTEPRTKKFAYLEPSEPRFLRSQLRQRLVIPLRRPDQPLPRLPVQLLPANGIIVSIKGSLARVSSDARRDGAGTLLGRDSRPD